MGGPRGGAVRPLISACYKKKRERERRMRGVTDRPSVSVEWW